MPDIRAMMMMFHLIKEMTERDTRAAKEQPTFIF
jgi:hypothetical protein